MENEPLFDNQHSDVQEIMNAQPHWITRRGLAVLFLVFALFFSIFLFIEYPEQLSYKARLDIGGKTVRAVFRIPQEQLLDFYIGQPVKTRFKSFPFAEYGLLNGSIAEVGDTASLKDDTFEVVVSLPEDGVTTKKKRIQYRQGLVLEVTVDAQKVSLIQDFFSNLGKK